MRQVLIDAFLDYFNNYLSVEIYAEHNGLTKEQANAIIDIGRALHEEHVALAPWTNKGIANGSR